MCSPGSPLSLSYCVYSWSLPSCPPRPWDAGRDGFVMGEGAGVLVMESLEHAQARGANIICEYMGGGLTCDAHHMTDPRADGLGVSTCIELALKDARIDRDMVNYINAHATRCVLDYCLQEPWEG
jgi:3-oxoacyl-[acyl-carrier-protein] synthase II